jgi:hypothetical protein
MAGSLRFAAAWALAVAASCGGGEAPAGGPGGVDVDTLVVSVCDTIGLEMGDSTYVFGMLTEVAHGSDGVIAALDITRARLSVYSPAGEFLHAVGSPGPGPGEFQIPIDFAVMSDGGYAVADAVARNISFFSSDGGFRDVMQGFFPTPPMMIEGSPGGTFVGQAFAMEITEEGVQAFVDVCRWSDSTAADLMYESMPVSLSMEGDGRVTSAAREPEVDFAVGPDGSVFIAEISDTLFSVKGFTPEGEIFLDLREEPERVPLTTEELEAGSLSLSIRVSDGETAAEMSRSGDVYPWRNVIASVGVDSLERIWIEMANEDRPFFRVYDYDGNLLFYAVTDEPFSPVTRPYFTVDQGGIVACDRDPVDYPKIYICELPEDR